MAQGPVIYASDDSEISKQEAIDYCRKYGLTRDDAMIVQRDGQTLVIAKRDIRGKIYAKR